MPGKVYFCNFSVYRIFHRVVQSVVFEFQFGDKLFLKEGLLSRCRVTGIQRSKKFVKKKFFKKVVYFFGTQKLQTLTPIDSKVTPIDS